MRKKINEYVETWKVRGYPEDLPDSVPDCLMRLNKAPSYKAICFAILKNDHPLQTLGFTPVVCESYNVLKRIELQARSYEDLRS